MPNLTYKFIIHHNIVERSGTRMMLKWYTNTELIRHAIDHFNWEKAFLNKNAKEKVNIFEQTVLNILRNFIPHETVLCDYRDPSWFNNKIKSLIHEQNIIFTGFRSDRRNSCLRRQTNCLQDCLNDSIEASKQINQCRKKFKTLLVNTKKLLEK